MRRARELAALALAALAAALGACRTVEEPVLAESWPAEKAAQPLSHADCVALAVRSAPNAAAWRAKLAGARAALAQAGTWPNPSLSLSWEDFGLPGGASAGPLQTTASIGYALEELFSRGGRRAAARHELRAREAELLAEAGALAAEVLHAYDELVAARSGDELGRRLEALVQQELEASEAFARAGLVAPLASERARLERHVLRLQRERLEARARELELSLGYSLGFEGPVALALSEPLSAATGEASLEREELLARAARQRPEIAAGRERYLAQLERARLEAGATRYLPVIGLGPRRAGGQSSGVASLDLSLPLFDTGAAALAAEEAELLAAASEWRASVRRVSAEVDGARARWLEAVEVREPGVRELRDRRRALRERSERLFLAGELSLEELALARREELGAEQEWLEARLESADARVELRAALGELSGLALDAASKDELELELEPLAGESAGLESSTSPTAGTQTAGTQTAAIEPGAGR